MSDLIPRHISRRQRYLAGAAVLLSLTLGACGGGGGSGAGGSPGPVPSLPSGRADLALAENEANYGLAAIGSSSAYSTGLSGQGVRVAVIDTGIDLDHPEFAGRIVAASRDINAARGDLQDGYGHGTWVTGVIAAARDEQGVHGVAYDSEILAVRGDAPSQACLGCGGARFFDSDLAAATRYAIAQGANVINFSLAGDGGGNWNEALAEAAAAGVAIVLAAGNDGADDPAASALFAASSKAAGHAIIAGASEPSGRIWAGSNRAGNGAEVYLLAPGVAITTTHVGGGYIDDLTGTSLATPHISGALALLAEAFPNLSGDQLVDILLDTAKPLEGVDPSIQGQGHLDLTAAFAPQGATVIPSGTTAASASSSVAATGMSLGTAFGDALNQAASLDRVLMLDRYGRAFHTDLRFTVGHKTAGALFAHRLAIGLPPVRQTNGDLGAIQVSAALHETAPHRLSYHHSDPDDDALASFQARASVGQRTSLAFARGATPLAFGLRGLSPSASIGFDNGLNQLVPRATHLALDHKLDGGLQLKAAVALADSHDTPTPSFMPHIGSDRVLARVELTGKVPGGGRIALQGGALHEHDALLGSEGHGAMSLAGTSHTAFLGLSGQLPISDTWRLAGSALLGLSAMPETPGSALTPLGPVRSDRFGVALLGAPGWLERDSLRLSFHQPMRVASAKMALDLPRYMTPAGEIRRTRETLDLRPSGREIVGEMAYGLSTGQSRLEFGARARRHAGHRQDAGLDIGGFIQMRALW